MKLNKNEINEINEINEFTKYKKYSSPFIKDTNFKNTTKLSQKLPTGKWIITEKIDGTNIRIILPKIDDNTKKRSILIGTRNLILNKNDKSSKPYLDCLQNVNLNKLKEYFINIKSTVIIYGEGYGAGVQKGGMYSPTKDFRVFDIRIGEFYQEFKYVEQVCIDNQLNIVPVIGEQDTINYNKCIQDLKSNKETFIKNGTGGRPEGFVYKYEPPMYDKYKERLIYKVKYKDFIEFD